MQESSENPDRLDGSKSFSLKNLYSLLNKSFSKILLEIGGKETDR